MTEFKRHWIIWLLYIVNNAFGDFCMNCTPFYINVLPVCIKHHSQLAHDSRQKHMHLFIGKHWKKRPMPIMDLTCVKVLFFAIRSPTVPGQVSNSSSSTPYAFEKMFISFTTGLASTETVSSNALRGNWFTLLP